FWVHSSDACGREASHGVTAVPAFARRLQDAPFGAGLTYQRVTARTQGQNLTAPGGAIGGVAVVPLHDRGDYHPIRRPSLNCCLPLAMIRMNNAARLSNGRLAPSRSKGPSCGRFPTMMGSCRNGTAAKCSRDGRSGRGEAKIADRPATS